MTSIESIKARATQLAKANKVIKSKATRFLRHVVKAKYNMNVSYGKKVEKQVPAATKQAVAKIKRELDAIEKSIQSIISAGPSVSCADFDEKRVTSLCAEADQWHQRLLQFAAGLSKSIR